MVLSTGIEPVSKPSESLILSIELRKLDYFFKFDTITRRKRPYYMKNT